MATEVEKQSKRSPAKREAEGTTENLAKLDSAYLPDASIYETESDLFIRLEIPGVEKGQVQIDVDETNTLQVRAKNAFQEPPGIQFREFAVGDYFRSFRLSEEFNKDAISATLEDGVLELKVAKKEEAKPKRISIKA